MSLDEEEPLEPVPPGDQLLCHRSMERVCGPACIAFLTTAPEGPEYTGQSWARCLELVSAHKSAKHVNIIAVELIKLNRRSEAKAADEARQGPPQNVSPIGSR